MVKEDFIENIKYVISKVEGDFSKVQLYVMPFEFDKMDVENISEKVGVEVKVFAVNDSTKYDPENRAKKAKPGKPGIYVE